MWQASLIAWLVKNPPRMQETREIFTLASMKTTQMEKATYSSILAWRIPRTV